jgi:hypothetical protein
MGSSARTKRTTGGADCRSITCYVPVSVDLDRLPEHLRDKCLMFTDLLHRKCIMLDADPGGWVALKTEYLRAEFGRYALPDMLGALIRMGVLECDRRYVIGECSRRYRAVPCDGPWVQVQIATPRKPNRRHTIPLAPVHHYLQRHLEQLTIDFPRAVEVVRQLEPDEDSRLGCEEYRKVILELCRVAHDGDFRLGPDQYGRVHSLFTRLPRELRACLRLHGEPIIGIDLANAQPLLAGAMCIRYRESRFVQRRILSMTFVAGDFCEAALVQLERMCGRPSPQVAGGQRPYDDLSTVLEKRYPGLLLPGSPPWFPPPLISGPPLSAHDGLPPDLQQYLEVCQRGEFYESLGDDREAVKKAMMHILFDRTGYRSEIKFRFGQLYPTVSQFLYDLKTKNSLPREDRYKYPSHLLQNFEASLFIGRICRRLMKERPDIPVLTLHDSLYSTKQFVDDLLRLMQEEFARIGLLPTFKMEAPHEQSRPSRAAGHRHVADGGWKNLRHNAGRVPDARASVC